MKLFLFQSIISFENGWSPTFLKHQYEDLPFFLLYSVDLKKSVLSSLSCLPDLYSFSELSFGPFLHTGQYFYLIQYSSVALLWRKRHYMYYRDNIPFYISKYGIHLLPVLLTYLCSDLFAELLPKYLFLIFFFFFLTWFDHFQLNEKSLHLPILNCNLLFLRPFLHFVKNFFFFFKFWTASLLTFSAFQKWKQRKFKVWEICLT